MTAPDGPTRVSVCVVGYRNAPDVGVCVEALARSTYADFDVVVCENGGPEAVAELTAVLPDRLPGGQVVTVLAADNPGFAGGVNRCLHARPDADAWWILNPDAEPDAGALLALVDRLRQGDVDAVGAVLHRPDGSVQGYGGRWRAWLARPVSLGQGARVDDPVPARAVEARLCYLLGASMLVGRRVLDRVGAMREDYFLYGEEVEWCLRARAAGLRLGLAPGARVLHRQGGTTGFSTPYRERPWLPIYLDERNKLNVVRDTTPRRLPVAAVAALLLVSTRYGRRRAWRQWGYGVAGWYAGLRNERGAPG